MDSSTASADRQPIKSVVQAILDDQRAVDLTSRDLALLVLMWHDLDGADDTTLAIAYASIQSLHSQLDVLELKDALGAERRLNETLARLCKADCIAKADMTRIGVVLDTEYQITPLGDSLAEWHIQQSEFSGEPLTVIFRSFISQLSGIADAAEKAASADEWHFDVVLPMQYALKAMLANINRHQKELDRRHSDLRDFIPSLLHEGSEEAIEKCETQLQLVIDTINDLQEVVFSSVNAAHAMIDRITELARPHNPRGVEVNCDDLSRRLQSIAQWTTQRAKDWVDHHNVVHHLLRTSIRIDRQRRITDALKRAIAVVPDWSLEVAAEPHFVRMRDDLRVPRLKRAPRLPKTQGQERQFDEIEPDELPNLLLRYLKEDLGKGEARASTILSKVAADAEAVGDLVFYFPWLMDLMVDAGRIDELRDWTAATDGVELQELRIIP